MSKQMAMSPAAGQDWWLWLKETAGRRHQVVETPDLWAEELLQQIAEAKVQWQNLQRVYNEVSDPRVVEHVILQLQATESRYGYLLQLGKEAFCLWNQKMKYVAEPGVFRIELSDSAQTIWKGEFTLCI